MRAYWLTLGAVAAIVATPAPGRVPTRSTAPATILIGQDWLGLWRNGHVATIRKLDGWMLRASRVRGAVLEVSAQRANDTASEDVVLRFDAKTLVPRGSGHDAALAQTNVRAPIGTDAGLPDDSAALPPALMPAGGVVRRVVLSPDRSVAAIFASRAGKGEWRGRVVDLLTRKPVTAAAPEIDDGTMRDDGASRAVACLLPRGEGVIYTLLGPPADRVSEFQRFGNAAPPVKLSTSYVMSCLVSR